MIPRTQAPQGISLFLAVARRLALSLLSLAILASAGGGAARAELLIGPGDTIRLTIQGLPNAEVDSMVGIDGYLPLVWPGPVLAEGRTLGEILADVRSMADGRVYKRYTPEGLLKLFQLSADDLALEVVVYRPVVVSGDVARPGEVIFRPGLTARSAIAVAGGIRSSLLANLAVADPTQIVRWQNEYARAALDHATALARQWRISAEISGETAPQPIDPQLVAVTREVLDSLSVEQVRLMDIRRKNSEGDRAYLQSVLEQGRARVRILTQQRANQRDLLDADEEEEARVRDLVERNLVPATRINEVRRNTVLSATRLLELESQLAAADLDVIRRQRDIEAYDEIRLADLLALREQVSAALLEARLRMDLLAQNLAGSPEGDNMEALLLNSNATIRVFRRVDGRIAPIVVEMDSGLEPGDTVEVVLDQPTETFPIQ